MSETYTLAEAQLELLRQECLREGHRPDRRIATLSDPIGWYACVCGDVVWRPQCERREAGR